jgi:hypothetical protein
MLWAFVDVLAFLVLVALVVVLARADTARWERQRRAAVVPRAVSPGDSRRRLRGARRLRARLGFATARARRSASGARSRPRPVVRARRTAVPSEPGGTSTPRTRRRRRSGPTPRERRLAARIAGIAHRRREAGTAQAPSADSGRQGP